MSETLFNGAAHYKLPPDQPMTKLGDQQRDIWITISKQESENDQLQELLLKILLAVRIKVNEQTCRWVTSEEGFRLSLHLADQKEASRVILVFGNSPRSLGLNLRHLLYRPVSLANNTLLFAHSLAEIQHSKDFKRSLWESLKNIFNSR